MTNHTMLNYNTWALVHGHISRRHLMPGKGKNWKVWYALSDKSYHTNILVTIRETQTLNYH